MVTMEERITSPRPLTRVETAAFADSIRALLADPDANLSRDARLRWEGALTAIEAVLGKAPSLFADEGPVQAGGRVR